MSVQSTQAPVCGAIKSPVDFRDYKAKVDKSVIFPKTFSLNWKVGVKDQNIVQSCVAHALAAVVEYYNQLQEGNDDKMSTGYLYGNREYTSHKDSGMITRDALKTLVHMGDVPRSVFPDNVETPVALTLFENRDKAMDELAHCNRISEYYSVTTEAEIKGALMNNNPVVFVVNMPTFYYFTGDNYIMNTLGEGHTGRHCMVIYGWDEDGWLFQNSWGVLFGRKGRAVLPYDFPILEAWGVSDTIVGETKELSIKRTSKLMIFLNTIYNFIISYGIALKRLFTK